MCLRNLVRYDYESNKNRGLFNATLYKIDSRVSTRPKTLTKKSPFTEEPVQMGHPKNIGNWLLYIGDHNEEIQCAVAISGKWKVRTSCQKQSKITFK